MDTQGGRNFLQSSPTGSLDATFLSGYPAGIRFNESRQVVSVQAPRILARRNRSPNPGTTQLKVSMHSPARHHTCALNGAFR